MEVRAEEQPEIDLACTRRTSGMVRWIVEAVAGELAAVGTAALFEEPVLVVLASLAAVVPEDKLVAVAVRTADQVAPGVDTSEVKAAAVAEDMSGPEPERDIVDMVIEEEAAPAFDLNMNMTFVVA